MSTSDYVGQVFAGWFAIGLLWLFIAAVLLGFVGFVKTMLG